MGGRFHGNVSFRAAVGGYALDLVDEIETRAGRDSHGG